MGINNPFKSSPEKLLAAEIEKLRSRRVDVERQLPDAEAAIINRQAAVSQLAADGAADDVLAKAEAAIGDAERRERTILGALELLDEQIAEKQAQLSAIVDKKERGKTAAHVETISDDVADVMARLAQIGQEVVEVFGRAEMYTPDAAGMRVLGERIVAEIPATAELLVAGLKAHKDMILNGSAPAMVREPAPPAPKPVPPEPTTKVYTVRAIRWRDPSNPVFTLTRPSFAQTDLPRDLAEQAIKLRAAIPVTDPQVAVLARHHPMKFEPVNMCVSLDGQDDDDAEQQEVFKDEIVKHSAFARP